MPDDALLAIFDPLPLTGIFTASQVCSQWRAAALARPPLWMHLEVRTTTRAPRDDDGYAYHPSVTVSNLRLVGELLPRSHTQPLKLVADATSPWSTPSSPFTGALPYL